MKLRSSVDFGSLFLLRIFLGSDLEVPSDLDACLVLVLRGAQEV